MIRILLFDLDETLYAPQTGVMDRFRARVLHYMRTRLNLTAEEADALRRHYLKEYGTTLRGLQANDPIDPEEFLSFVHDLPLDDILAINPELDAVLAEIPQDKVVFTNASGEHAERVLALLGIRRHFARIVDVRDVEYESKPQPSAYRRVCELLGVRPEECLLVEDNVQNLRPAKDLGMVTVLVHDGHAYRDERVDFTIPRIEAIGAVVKQFVRGGFQMTIQGKFDGQWTTDWNGALAKRTERMQGSIIRELLKLTSLPDIISFGGGMPAPEAFPVRDFRDACGWILDHDPEGALQYGPTEGFPPLKDYLIEAMAKYEIPAVRDNVLFTNGSQQALDLIGRAFVNDGDTIITERPTYLGAIQAWNVYGPEFVTVPMDDDGMLMYDLEHALAANPGAKFIYVLPNFHNPAGTTLCFERRLRLVELAAQHGVFILEDDPYGQLRFEGEDITPIFTMHKENTIYLSTFSKTLAPGLRLGWIVAPERVITKLVQAKQGMDLHTSTLVQYLAYDICQRGLMRAHVRKIRELYRERRDAMLAAMQEHFPPEVKWTRPQGGLFLWARMPEYMDSEALLRVAVEEKVIFVPGSAFYPGGNDGRCCMRLNFSNATPPMIEEGIKRLGRAIKRMMAESQA